MEKSCTHFTWIEFITARIRRMTEIYVFSLSTTGGGGLTPSPACSTFLGGGGVTQSLVPILLSWGVPYSQILGTPFQAGGTPVSGGPQSEVGGGGQSQTGDSFPQESVLFMKQWVSEILILLFLVALSGKSGATCLLNLVSVCACVRMCVSKVNSLLW